MFQNMDDGEFLDFVSQVYRELGSRIKTWQQMMPRAIRLPNSQTQASACARVLHRAKMEGKTGLTKSEVAMRVINEENYHTDTSGKKWERSVYQSGIRPLLQDGVVVRCSDLPVMYCWAGPEDIDDFLSVEPVEGKKCL